MKELTRLEEFVTTAQKEQKYSRIVLKVHLKWFHGHDPQAHGMERHRMLEVREERTPKKRM